MERQGRQLRHPFKPAGLILPAGAMVPKRLMGRAMGGHTHLAGRNGTLTVSPEEEAILAHQPINLAEKLSRIQDFWNPRIVGELNDQHVKLAKVKGEFVWHHHENEDELFFVLKGELRLEFREGAVTLGPGEVFIVPRGTEHRPVAQDEVHLLMFEPASTVNTGNVRNERTVEDPQRI